MSDLHALEWRIREATQLVAAANSLIEEQRALIVDLEAELDRTRREAVSQLWTLRNISTALVNSWVSWRKPIGSLDTCEESRQRSLARWELNKSTWYEVDDALLGRPYRATWVRREASRNEQP